MRENTPPSALDQLLELDRRLFNLERRVQPNLGGSGALKATDFVCVNVGGGPPFGPGGGDPLTVGSIAVPITTLVGGGCGSGERITAYLALFPTAG